MAVLGRVRYFLFGFKDVYTYKCGVIALPATFLHGPVRGYCLYAQREIHGVFY